MSEVAVAPVNTTAVGNAVVFTVTPGPLRLLAAELMKLWLTARSITAVGRLPLDPEWWEWGDAVLALRSISGWDDRPLCQQNDGLLLHVEAGDVGILPIVAEVLEESGYDLPLLLNLLRDTSWQHPS
jgi:hypothetical protein